MEFAVLAPTHSQVGHARSRRAPNYASVIMRVRVGDTFSALVTGDASSRSWRRLLKRDRCSVKSLVLRLPHHGGRIGVNPRIADVLAAVEAAYHVVSVGTNSGFRHPCKETLDALQAYRQARVMCTEASAACLGRAWRENGKSLLPPDSLKGLGDLGGAVRCAGSVWFYVGATSVAVSPELATHYEVMAGFETPRCLGLSPGRPPLPELGRF
jgi:hypothetical protein